MCSWVPFFFLSSNLKTESFVTKGLLGLWHCEVQVSTLGMTRPALTSSVRLYSLFFRVMKPSFRYSPPAPWQDSHWTPTISGVFSRLTKPPGLPKAFAILVCSQVWNCFKWHALHFFAPTSEGEFARATPAGANVRARARAIRVQGNFMDRAPFLRKSSGNRDGSS